MSISNRITPIELKDVTQTNIDPESNATEYQKELNPIESWLPITESRNGNVWSCVFHLVSSGLGMQALLLPFAFATLGWAWGVTYLSLGFMWQLYTRWLLVHLHESSSGVRYSRFVQLAMVAFGPKLAKWLCMIPILYLSGGTCTLLVITGGSTLKLLYELIFSESSNCPKNLSTNEWFLIFVCLAFLLAQHPNLNSLVWVSLLGTIASIVLISLLWITSIAKGRVENVSYNPIFEELEDNLSRFLSTFSAMEMIALSFQGHNLVLEIQGTLPTNSKIQPHITMWKAVKISYCMMSLCLFPLAISGYWAYGNKITRTGIIYTLGAFHKDSASTTMLGLILVIFVLVHQLCTYQIYAMASFDNIEFRYVLAKDRPCPSWLRSAFRLLYCFVGNLFLAITFPFLPSLGSIVGAIGLLVTFSYPCFIYVCIKKPKVWGPMFLLNLGLGCLGVVLSIFYFIVAIWEISREGLTANFFNVKW
ncbi:lysine histidine transporter-like 8 [Chenopodium quinoa]|uniref:lysine histidine transporter-like 8 n=1 Tax=Chenopodium quinoa TaxID=63459 RepID=UPI000B790B4E|nr:lysine histidine transporter-like 8 [Chenopodium quinoa]